MKTTSDVAYLAPELVGRELPSPPRESRLDDDVRQQPNPHRHLRRTGYAFWEVMILSAILTFVALALFAQTPYDFSTSPYDHFQTSGPCKTYSGNSCIQPQQFGFIAIDPIAHTHPMLSGIGKQGAPYEPPVTYIIPFGSGKPTDPKSGDCNQSCSKVAASAVAKKWVLTSGTEQNCAASSCAVPFVDTPPGSNHWLCSSPRPSFAVQVWKFEAGNWAWKGQIGSDLFLYQHPPIRVVGDFGYMLETHAGIPTPPPVWSKMDLNAMSIVQTGIPEASVPPGEAQPNIGGVTYTLSKTGNMTYRLAPNGTPPPTVTPVPTPPPAPNPYAAWCEAAYLQGYMSPCGPGLFCPGDSVQIQQGFVSRAQEAVFLMKSVHGPSYVPPTCTGLFTDTRCK